MAAHEIAFVDPQIMLVDDQSIAIPAGTIAVIPHYPLDLYHEEFEAKNDPDFEPTIPPLPEFTILACEQELKRVDYPELSAITADGGFYTIVLPNLTKKFIIGIDAETNEIKWGDGIIYYQSVPVPERTGQPQIVNR